MERTKTPRSDMDQAAVLVHDSSASVDWSRLAISRALTLGDWEAVREALGYLKKARSANEAALNRLLLMGASRPMGEAETDTLSLELLDTPANRRFLAALEEAAEAGAAVDRERGWLDSDGEPTGYGETLSGMALLCRREIFGPEGRD